jgi:transcriptional regulator with XRE-family HTH domain
MAERLPTGIRIRERRQERGLRQAELAASVGISPSYLNLIEHGRRRIAGKLLGDIARALDLDPAGLSESPDIGRLLALQAAAQAIPEALRPPPEMDRAQDLADRFPGWAALVAAQARRIATLQGRVDELAARLSHDHDLAQALHRVISGVTGIRSASGILAENPDLDRDWQSRFLNNIRADSEALAEASRELTRFLEGSGEAPPALSPQESAERWLDARDHHLPEAEDGRLPPDLPGGSVGEVLRAWIALYAEDARALPLRPFAEIAREEGYDPAPIVRRTGATLTQVLRRLASLPPGHPSHGLAIADASGTVLHLKALDGAGPLRAGGCPIWPLFEAFGQPGRGLRALAALPGQAAPRFLCHAVAAPAEEPGWDAPPRLQATMLFSVAPAGSGGTDRLVGPTCRLCPRKPCPARREPSILG